MTTKREQKRQSKMLNELAHLPEPATSKKLVLKRETAKMRCEA
jgi:hypothetical protein